MRPLATTSSTKFFSIPTPHMHNLIDHLDGGCLRPGYNQDFIDKVNQVYEIEQESFQQFLRPVNPIYRSAPVFWISPRTNPPIRNGIMDSVMELHKIVLHPPSGGTTQRELEMVYIFS